MRMMCDRDWLTLLAGIRRLHEQDDPSLLAATMLEVVEQLVPCDHSSYDEIDLVRKSTAGMCSDPAIDAQWPRLEEAAAAHFHEHPVLHYFRSHPHAGARRISDFLPPADFHESGLYHECYRHIGVDHQMVMRLPGQPGTEVGIALSRSGLDFSDQDRRRLNLLRPHLHQAYRQCLDAARLRDRAAGSTMAVESIAPGVVVVDEHDRMLLCTPHAQRMLARYFPGDIRPASRLPEPLEPWTAALRAVSDTAQVPEHPLLVDGRDGRLSISAMRSRRSGTWVLRLEEHSPEASARALRQLGLTRRQAQVLYWVAQGKTNPEIAIILDVSPRTVQKHLEHIFQVLCVETRTMATVKAMEALSGSR